MTRAASAGYKRSRLLRSIALGLAVASGGAPPIVGAASFDDVQFWVGEGPNQAAIVVDWPDASAADRSLVWGFRFTGEATGADMLSALLTADSRLYAKTNDADDMGLALFGLGYDWNRDDQLALTDGAQFDADGVSRGAPADGAVAIDPLDAYAEGWFFSGYWYYATSEADPFAGHAVWEPSLIGASDRALVDGVWDGWTFSPTFEPAVPQAPLPAPMLSITGDFDRNDYVDGADLLLLQRTFLATAQPFGAGADGNADGMVDAADQTTWAAHFGERGGAAIATSSAGVVPEPAALRLLLAMTFVVALWRCATGYYRLNCGR